jgi:hypothetical protein
MPRVSPNRPHTYHGSSARILDKTNTPYVEMRETIILANIGLPNCFTAWMAHKIAQTNILRLLGDPVKATY